MWADGLDLPLRHATVKMRADVVRLGWRATVGVPPNVQVAGLVFDDGLGIDYLGETRHIPEGIICADDLLDVFGVDKVLCPAFAVFTVGVYEEHFAFACLGFAAGMAHDKDAGRDAGSIEQVLREGDHGLDAVLVRDNLAILRTEETEPDLLFFATTKRPP